MTTLVKYNKHHIYGILKNYFWMVREIQRWEYELKQTSFTGVAQYGLEATLPKPQGIVGKALENEIVRRSEKSKRLIKYSEEVNFINERRGNVTDEKEKVILDCILDGLSLTAISKHLRMSRKQITVIRDNIVDQMGK